MKQTLRTELLGAVLIAAATAGSLLWATVSVREPVVAKDPLDVRILAKPDNLSKPDATRPVKRLSERHSAQAEALTFTGAFQSFHQDYEFNFEGGEFLSYDVSVVLDGESATISNLFNLIDGYPYDNSEQYDIKGSYDADANTITVSTPPEFDIATVAGKVYGVYPLTVICGTVDAAGGITPADELVITLSDDHTRASFDKNFGLRMYTAEGEPQGFKCIYKGALMKTDLTQPELVCFTDALDFGKCWVSQSKEKEFNVFNLGSDMEASLDVSGDAFSPEAASVTLASLEPTSVLVTVSPASEGNLEGILDVGGSHSIALSCAAEMMPDYSFIVDEGEITFDTDSDHPFVKDTYNGTEVARSSNDASVSDSYLEARFSVPEGKLGVFSWKGWSSSEVSFSSNPSIIADGKEIFNYAGLLNASVDNSYTFGPGEHSVFFKYSVYSGSYFSENDRMWIHGLNLGYEDLEENKAKLLTESISFPNSILYEGATEKYSTISIRNEGAAPLEVTAIDAPDCIRAEMPYAPAATLETADVYVAFSASAAGEYNGDILVKTTAGDFTVPFSALVRDLPDFQSIVAGGEFSFTTSEEYPFLVENGVAFNSTSKVKDEVMTSSSMTASFVVPEGKLGVLSWKGRVSCMPYDEAGWTDYLSLIVSNASGTVVNTLPGEIDLDTENYPYFEAPDISNLLCPPGYGYVTFNYIQYGDGVYGGDDIVEVSDLKLELIDSEAESAVLVTESVTFPEVYQGKTSSAYAVLHNTGTEELEVLDVVGDGVFEGDIPSRTVPFNQKLEVPLFFYPVEAGEQQGSVTIVTTAGEFTVNCLGTATSMDGIILAEDFEDDAANWMVYDRDGDGDAWNLAWNVYGGVTAGHVHSGEECIVSFSWDYVSGDFTPDNWTFSPAFEVPASGAFLTWYVAGDDNSRLGDKYSVYVAEGGFEDAFNLDDYTCVFSDEIVSDEWGRKMVDLSQFAGKTVHVAFRHHDSKGLYMVKIDDVFVYDHNPDSVGEISGQTVESIEYYTIDGIRVNRPGGKGIFIMKTRYTDGTVSSCKVIRE